MWLPNMITLVLGFQNSNENLSNTLRPRRSSEWLIIISWLIFTFPAMQAHQWVLDNMDKWVEKYLIADNSIRIRNGRWSCRYSYEKRWPCSDIFVHCDSLSKYSNVGGIGHFKVARETGSRWGTHFQHRHKFVPQNSPTMHFDNYLDPFSRATSKWRIDHFRLLKTLTFKMRPRAQPFLWKWVLFTWEWKIISISKAEHLTSFWYRGPGELENGLLPAKKSVELPENLTIACVFLQPQRICLWVLFPTITSDRDSGECLCQIPFFDVHNIQIRFCSADVYFLHKTWN